MRPSRFGDLITRAEKSRHRPSMASMASNFRMVSNPSLDRQRKGCLSCDRTWARISPKPLMDTHLVKPRGILHFFVLTEALPRLTARKAATIEPTIQVPISAVTALNDNAPNNSTILSSIRTTSISREACLNNRRTDCRVACVLRSSRLSNALRWLLKDATKAVRRPPPKLPSGSYLPSGFWSKTSASF